MSGLPLVNEISHKIIPPDHYQGHSYQGTIWSGRSINFQRLTMKLVEKYPLQITLQSLSQILNQTILMQNMKSSTFACHFQRKMAKLETKLI